MIEFLEDGSMNVTLHRVKNDYDRDGFVLNVPCASDPKLDPIAAMGSYIARTEPYRPSDT